MHVGEVLFSQDPYDPGPSSLSQIMDTSFYAQPSNWPQPSIPTDTTRNDTNWAEEEASHWAYEASASTSRQLNQILSPEDLKTLEQKYDEHCLTTVHNDYNARDERDR